MDRSLSLVLWRVAIALVPASASCAATPAAPPPTLNGIYQVEGFCTAEDGGCPPGPARLREAATVFARPDPTSPRIGEIAAGAWARMENSLLRLRPLKGVVQQNGAGLTAGETVFLLEPDSEGAEWLWHKGEKFYWMPDGSDLAEDTQIRWEMPLATWSKDRGQGREALGEWTLFTLPDGRKGWAPDSHYDMVSQDVAELSPASFICDGIDVPRIAVARLSGDAISIAVFDKTTHSFIENALATREEGGDTKGFLDWDLTLNGKPYGYYDQKGDPRSDPQRAFTAKVLTFKLNADYDANTAQGELTCRWSPRTRLLGFTQNQTVQVTEDMAGHFKLRLFDFNPAPQLEAPAPDETSTQPRLMITAGQLVQTGATQAYGFSGKVAYRVEVTGAKARLVTVRGDKTTTEDLLAFQTGAPPKGGARH